MNQYLISTIIGLLFCVVSMAQSFKIDPSVSQKVAAQGMDDFIILVKDDTKLLTTIKGNKLQKAKHVFQALQNRAKRTQTRLQNDLKKWDVEFHALFIVNAICAKGDLLLLERLSMHPDVEKIIPNPKVQLEFPQEESYSLEQRGAIEWGILNMKADQLWDMGYKGKGVVVAGQDTGYDWEHPALKQQYRGNQGNSVDHNYNWHDAIHEINPMNDTINDPTLNPCGLDSAFPCDDNNHGTHTMGTVVGEDGENQIGVAPEAEWMACRNMERGYGTPFSYLECFEWFLAPTNLTNTNPRPALAPHVIVNSWSCPVVEGCTLDNFVLLEEAVNNLKASGIMVVVSAGNRGRNGCASVDTPAAIFENSFSVGAIASNDTIADFSSRGAVLVDGSRRLKPNVSAPGVGVLSAVRGGEYRRFSGTSMSGPHIAGLVALLISANPELAGQVEALEDIIEQSARPMGAEQDCGDTVGTNVPNNTYGYGNADAIAALELALQFSDTSQEIAPTFKVFPNPFQEIFWLETDDLSIKNVRILDASGRTLKTLIWEGNSSNEISLTGFPSGIYFYEIQSQKAFHYGKMVKL